jgi:hypothetical protein
MSVVSKTETPPKQKPIISREVVHWPEYRALAKRLGIDDDAAVTRIVITLDGDKPVMVERRQLCQRREGSPPAKK